MIEVKIKQVSNGYCIEYTEDLGDGEFYTRIVVIEESHDDDWQHPENGRNKAFLNLVYYLKETFGILYSKHNKTNFVCSIEKYEEENEETDPELSSYQLII